MPPSLEAEILPRLAIGPSQIDWMEDRVGRYPLDAMGSLVIRADLGFALETQTLSLLDTYWFEDQPVGYGDATLLHELSHMWFGDSVAPLQLERHLAQRGPRQLVRVRATPRSRASSPTTRSTIRTTNGYDTVDELMHAVYKHSDQWRHDSGPVAHPIDADHLFDLQVYHGGALVLYALRQVVGARTFERIERAWVTRYRDRVATTDDFIALASQVSHRDLRGFLRAWVYGTKTPPMPGPPGLEGGPGDDHAAGAREAGLTARAPATLNHHEHLHPASLARGRGRYRCARHGAQDRFRPRALPALPARRRAR